MRAVRGLALSMAFLGVLGATACSTTGKSYIPVDSPLRPWPAPEGDEPAAATPSAAHAAPAPATAAEKTEKKGKK